MNANFSPTGSSPDRKASGDPRLWRSLASDLARTVRRRIDRVEVEDVVQATLTEALAAKALPAAEEEIRRFVFAIARQKVADVYRRRRREQRRMLSSEPLQQPFTDPSAELGGAGSALALRTWVDRTLPAAPSAERTLEWMLREADGETLADIAAKDRVPATMVRQRVSRLRRWLRTRWAKEVAGLAAVLAVALALVALRGPAPATSALPHGEEIVRDPSAKPAPEPLPPAVPSSEPAPRPAEMVPNNVPPWLRPRSRKPVTPPPAPSSAAPGSTANVTANLTVHTRSTASPNGQATVETTYEVTLPTLPTARCATDASPHGVSHIELLFRADGSVERAHVDSGVLVGRPEAACVERLYSSRVRIRPVEGGPVVAGTFFRVIPEDPPAWTHPSK